MATFFVPEPLAHEIDELRSEGLIASAEEFAEQAIRKKKTLGGSPRSAHQSNARLASEFEWCWSDTRAAAPRI